jgi:hypothetical protein
MYISEETKIKIANKRAKEAYEKKLAESDYKIIKCYEYSLANLQLPYDIQKLH